MSRSSAHDHGSRPRPSVGPFVPYPGMYGRLARGSLIGGPPPAPSARTPVRPRYTRRSVTAYQTSLLGAGDPAIDPAASFERMQLDDQSWVDVARGWLRGADTLLDALIETVAWEQHRRWMYERMVDDPRLSRWLGADEPVPHPVLPELRGALEAHYGVVFGGIGLNYYRDGRDSVAPHHDRELRHLDDTLIAIVTLGARRPFLRSEEHTSELQSRE